jgi:hypothetical protein
MPFPNLYRCNKVLVNQKKIHDDARIIIIIIIIMKRAAGTRCGPWHPARA